MENTKLTYWYAVCTTDDSLLVRGETKQAVIEECAELYEGLGTEFNEPVEAKIVFTNALDIINRCATDDDEPIRFSWER